MNSPFAGPSCDLPWPPARNPWNRDHFCGGSSSGSGAGLAAGFFPAALGTDTGGSIRNPASMCGITGMKTTHGRVSRRRAGAEQPAPPYGAMLGHDIKGLRIGIIRHFYTTDVVGDPEQVDALDAAARLLAEAGATTTEITLAPL